MPITDQHKNRRAKNFAIAGVLAFLVILFFVVTIIKLAGNGG